MRQNREAALERASDALSVQLSVTRRLYAGQVPARVRKDVQRKLMSYLLAAGGLVTPEDRALFDWTGTGNGQPPKHPVELRDERP